MTRINLQGNNKWDAASVYDPELDRDQHSLNADAVKAVELSEVFKSVVEENFSGSGTEMTGTVTASYIAANKEITYYGGIYRCLEVDVMPGQEISLAAWAGWLGWFYVYYDQNGQFVSGQQSANAASTTIEADTVVPDGAVKLAVAGSTSSMPTATLVSGYKLITDATLSVPNMAADAKSVGDRLGAVFETDYVDYAVELTADSVINGSRVVQTGAGANYKVSGILPVVPGDKFKLSAAMNYGNYFYVFYDSGGTAFGGEKAEAGGTWSYLEEEEITVPEGAAGFRIGFYAGSAVYSFQKRSYVISQQMIEEAMKNWKGKKWAVIGDSLTAANNTASRKYHALIAEKSGITVLNYGRDGTGYANPGQAGSSFADRALQLQNVDCDVITIFGSFNDLGESVTIELGTEADTGTGTVGGCMNTALDNLYAAKPFVPVGIILPTPWWGLTPDGSTENRAKAVQYCELLRKVAERRSIPVLDLFHRSGFHPNESNYRTEYFANADGTHPNNKGHALIAPAILQFLETLMPMG